VIEAENGAAGVDLARRHRPGLILMDLSMPDVDGWEALRQLRADDQTRLSRIVAITAHAMVGDRERALYAGFDGYLSKPIDAATFAQTISAYLR
jgi:CheY-like chemotaxis protein